MSGSSFFLSKKLLLIFLIFGGLYFGKDFIMPLSVGAIIATFFLPFCKWLESKRVHRLLAPLLCIFVLLIFLGGIGALLRWQFWDLTDDAANLKQKVTEIIDNIQQNIYETVNISKEDQTKIFKEERSSMTKMIQPFLSSLLYVFTNFILVTVYIYLLLYYRRHISQFILKLAAPDKKQEVAEVVYKAANVSQQYLLGLAKMIACLWIMYSIGFSIAGVNNFIFFAILCGLLEIVPYIGNITGTTLTVLVSAVQGESNSTLLGIVITYGIIQFIQGWVLETVIVGPQVKINALFTILALVLGELIWGIPGVVLAIPLTGMLKIIYDHVESLKPYGFLMGETELAKEPGQEYLTRIKKWLKKK